MVVSHPTVAINWQWGTPRKRLARQEDDVWSVPSALSAERVAKDIGMLWSEEPPTKKSEESQPSAAEVGAT